MADFFKLVRHKINHSIWTLSVTGVILLMLGILIVWTDFMLRLVVGLFVLVVGYAFLYLAYRIWAFKRDMEKHFEL